MKDVIVVGAGLAGSEAAYKLASLGVHVKLYEQKPIKRHAAFKTDLYSELICSNSLRSDSLENAVGLLKEEMRTLGSLIMEAADATKVEAGKSLAVDRLAFSKYITDKINNHPNIEVIHEEYTSIDTSVPTIIAAGPLCSRPTGFIGPNNKVCLPRLAISSKGIQPSKYTSLSISLTSIFLALITSK